MGVLTVAWRGRDLPVEVTESTTCAEVVQAVQKYSPDLPLAEHTLRLILPRHEAPLQLNECPSKPLLAGWAHQPTEWLPGKNPVEAGAGREGNPQALAFLWLRP